jgi:hypothetical protein
MTERRGIFKQADDLIDAIHNQIIENLNYSMKDDSYLDECESEHQEPTYRDGFSDGMKQAILTIEMFRDGEL